ncbi:Arf GTPase activating protein [Conidiobolus coronatus NRRL 28638]|uniref:Arf GTPase activating protein n=1 Tax=Conidiobolus coronatus (strain ATCC 28846 / CBS 209.66 / NRRL 28638) TaxID=796925 RepID=A0A137NYW6_CONC2|nr:Arf GTPase activating protein [Conidiobolus coronatus NRRL 28638]|eukprot:KXN67976.1 Arf GTPase activating protein [Conidiobolus coronatus NRRL 28638]
MSLQHLDPNELIYEVQDFQRSSPENLVCADCKTPDPRWASYNLGCFLCLRCSGIHRSLGTHISKVKSIDLDTWTVEQVQSMLDRGNKICNQYWEAKLPEDFLPPQR